MKFRYIIIWFIIYIHRFTTTTQGGLAKSEVSSNYMDEDRNSNKEYYINSDYIVDESERDTSQKANLKKQQFNESLIEDTENSDVLEDKLEKNCVNNVTRKNLSKDYSIKSIVRLNSLDKACHENEDLKSIEENEKSIKYRPFFNKKLNNIRKTRNSSAKTFVSENLKKLTSTISWQELRALLNKESKKKNNKSKGSIENVRNKSLNKNNITNLVSKNNTNITIHNIDIKKQVEKFGSNETESIENVTHKTQTLNFYTGRKKTTPTRKFNQTTPKSKSHKVSTSIFKPGKLLEFVNLKEKTQKISTNTSYPRKLAYIPAFNLSDQTMEIFYNVPPITHTILKLTTPFIRSKKIEATKSDKLLPTIRILALLEPMFTKKEKALVVNNSTGKRICSVTPKKPVKVDKSTVYNETESTSELDLDTSSTKTDSSQDETETTEAVETSVLTTDKVIKTSIFDNLSTKTRKTCAPGSAKIDKTSTADKISSSTEELLVDEMGEESVNTIESIKPSTILKTTLGENNYSKKESCKEKTEKEGKICTVPEPSDFSANTTIALSLLTRGLICTDSLPRVAKPVNTDLPAKAEKTDAVSEFSTISISSEFLESKESTDDKISEILQVLPTSDAEEKRKIPSAKESTLNDSSATLDQTTVIIEFSKEFPAVHVFKNLTEKLKKVYHPLSLLNENILEKSSNLLEVVNATDIKNPTDNTSEPSLLIKLNFNDLQMPGSTIEMYRAFPVSKHMEQKEISFLAPKMGKSVKILAMNVNSSSIDKIDEIIKDISKKINDEKLFEKFKGIKSHFESVTNKKVDLLSKEKLSYTSSGKYLNVTRNLSTTIQAGRANDDTYTGDESKTNKTLLEKYLKFQKVNFSNTNNQHPTEFTLGSDFERGENNKKRMNNAKSKSSVEFIPILKSKNINKALLNAAISKQIKQIKSPAESTSFKPLLLEILDATDDKTSFLNTQDKEMPGTNYILSMLNALLINSTLSGLNHDGTWSPDRSPFPYISTEQTQPYTTDTDKNNSLETEANESVGPNYIASSLSQFGYQPTHQETVHEFSSPYFKSTRVPLNLATPCASLNLSGQNIVKPLLRNATGNFSAKWLNKDLAPGDLSSYYQLWKTDKNNSRVLHPKNGTCDIICIDDDKMEAETNKTSKHEVIFTSNKYNYSSAAPFTSPNGGKISTANTQGEKLNANRISESFTSTSKLLPMTIYKFVYVNTTNVVDNKNLTQMSVKSVENALQSVNPIESTTSSITVVNSESSNLQAFKLFENTVQSPTTILDRNWGNKDNSQSPTTILDRNLGNKDNSQLSNLPLLPNLPGYSTQCGFTTVPIISLPTATEVATICMPIIKYNNLTTKVLDYITTEVPTSKLSSESTSSLCTSTLSNTDQITTCSTINISKPTAIIPPINTSQYCLINLFYNTEKPSNVSMTSSELNPTSIENTSKLSTGISVIINFMNVSNSENMVTHDTIIKNNKVLKGSSNEKKLRFDAQTPTSMLRAKTILNEQRNFIMSTAAKIKQNSLGHSILNTAQENPCVPESQKNSTMPPLVKAEWKSTTRKRQFLVRVKGKNSAFVQSFPKVIKVVGGERYLSKILNSNNPGPIKEILVNLTIADKVHVNGSLKCIYSDNGIQNN